MSNPTSPLDPHPRSWSQRFAAVFAPGLSVKQRLRAIPVLGYGFAVFSCLIQLPKMREHTDLRLDNLERALHDSIQAINADIVGLRHELAQQLTQINELYAQKAAYRLSQYDALDIGRRLMELDQLQIKRRLNSVSMELDYLREKSKVLNSEKQLPATQAKELVHEQTSSTKKFDHDHFYHEFEALFRGSRADIKKRLQVYLPYLKTSLNQASFDRLPFVDVGCGRGEWLEIMEENKIPAYGVDVNLTMVEQCRAQGFLVHHADAIEFLRQQQAGSIAGVTGFQIIEHLSFDQWVALLDAAHHALCEGGIVIFETPNPENLKVGACNFYFDPTHRNPIVPQVAQFLTSHRGFKEVEILRLHPYPAEFLIPGDDAVARALNQEFYGAQDYAVIGKK